MRLSRLSSAAMAACLFVHTPAGLAGELTLHLTLAAGTPGRFGCALFTNEVGFPMNPEPSRQQWLTPDAEGRATCTFANLPEGTYAVSALNDTNGNRSADTDLFGRPEEAWGVTRGARFRFRPPRFEEASITVAAEGVTQLDLVLDQ